MTFLTPFLKVLNLQGKVASTLGGNWFQLFMVLFTKEYLPTSVQVQTTDARVTYDASTCRIC
jgi:hypothetical protein